MQRNYKASVIEQPSNPEDRKKSLLWGAVGRLENSMKLDSSIGRMYGQWKMNAIQSYLQNNFGFKLTSLHLEGLRRTKDGSVAMDISMHRGDMELLEYFVTDEDLQMGMDTEIASAPDHYKDCPPTPLAWREQSLEKRSPEARGLLLNAATEYRWQTELNPSVLFEKIVSMERAHDLMMQRSHHQTVQSQMSVA